MSNGKSIVMKKGKRMTKQYAISFNDRMSTYGPYGAGANQSAYYIEGVTGIINAECEKGARYVDAVYVDNRPAVLIFEIDSDVSSVNNSSVRW